MAARCDGEFEMEDGPLLLRGGLLHQTNAEYQGSRRRCGQGGVGCPEEIFSKVRVYSEPATDSDGYEALHVTIVLRSDARNELGGDSALDTIVRIQRDLRNSGKERFPIVEFVTERELDSNDNTES